jgi:hypothetical protein
MQQIRWTQSEAVGRSGTTLCSGGEKKYHETNNRMFQLNRFVSMRSDWDEINK